MVVDTDGYLRPVLDPVEPDALVDLAVRALSEPLPPLTGDASTPA